jgi:FlaA1/EpsC-like NDP-sugar epimerase
MYLALIKKLVLLSRIQKTIIMILIDSLMAVSLLFIAFNMRLGYWYLPQGELFWIIFGSPLIAIPVFVSFRLYKSVVRYIGVKALSSIVKAVTLYAVIWGLLGYMARIEEIPRSVILINWMLSIFAFGGSRLIARWMFSDRPFLNSNKKNVIIYGAGLSGRQLSHALQLSKEFNHVAYIDDSFGEDYSYINNIPVYPYNRIQTIIHTEKVSEVLLALPSISLKKKNEIIEKLGMLPVQVRSLPSVSEFAEGKVKIDSLLEIDTNNLLGRDLTKPNEKLLKTNIANKIVMVTGAGGSIGSELCRQIVLLGPMKLILFDISESSLYQIEQELSSFQNSIEIHPVLGSVLDKLKVQRMLEYYSVQTIYHAAAYKHVPLVEINPAEGVLNNTIGTMVFAEAAILAKVELFVLISTDKAVRPTNIMGASKRVAELVLQAFAKQSHKTCFTMVRFGNVINSSGSVIPLFKKQIREGGPITVTHENVVRYFMTIPESVELVLQAGAMAEGGDVFVLDMGDPVRIYDLAVKMIQLSGLQLQDENNPDGDIAIHCTGLRPGEKLYEELLVGNDSTKTDNNMIMRANEELIDWDKLKPMIIKLKNASKNNDSEKIIKLLLKIVPEFSSSTNNIS